ncbi:MAG: hypothetical protein CM1200mP12_20420 [Gammaproteobacteria bacterium]|jgi:hypothetical protein|nr:hypothetical protein [Candidatus Neomarinimicrobiota bacterium]GIS76323.1 MAG: hypothetical protein CM1200mP12_20420 [Gammaproteobacteria bacterium]|tara:strand:- start:330 stop:569 length:240 start_codon:yes stop_codon:yes gene_type:complete
MSTITLLLALLGIASFAVLFYFLRFKASSRQTDRDNRIPWHKIWFQRERYKETKASIEEQKQPKVEKQSSEEEDADFKD